MTRELGHLRNVVALGSRDSRGVLQQVRYLSNLLPTDYCHCLLAKFKSCYFGQGR